MGIKFHNVKNCYNLGTFEIILRIMLIQLEPYFLLNFFSSKNFVQFNWVTGTSFNFCICYVNVKFGMNIIIIIIMDSGLSNYSISWYSARYNLPVPNTIIKRNRLDHDILDKHFRTIWQVLRTRAFYISM